MCTKIFRIIIEKLLIKSVYCRQLEINICNDVKGMKGGKTVR